MTSHRFSKYLLRNTFAAIVTALPVFITSTAHAAPMKCVLEVKGRVYMNGPCDVTQDGDGSFQFSSSKNNYFGSVNIKEEGGPHGYWNGEEAASHAQNPLGVLTHVGDCWSNTSVRLCLSTPQRSDIDALPSCDAAASTVEKILQKRTGDLTRHIIAPNIKKTNGMKRLCTAMFAENYVDDAAIRVTYEISGSGASGYSVRLLSDSR